jgi:predicted unusual protein kinase regulating ubiquinone biosynthesis (AarF/ABC1/UbiB family)
MEQPMQPQPPTPTPSLSQQATRLDRRRYWRVVAFFAGVIANIVWWELIARWFIGRKRVAQGRPKRFERYAISFRKTAIKLGGVMIKLGQFISARIDVMPPEITDALADLQDEVPPEALDRILPLIESELGQSAHALFKHFDTTVRASASLGQVYAASLQSDQPVMVKVLRPGIENIVATDLAALRVVGRVMMAWSVIRKRADVPRLLNEFARTLWEELDYRAEADSAARFRELFARDAGVRIPITYPEFSADRVLTLEDVTFIKITDTAGLDAAGIDRKIAARRLMDVYLKMIFDFSFFHADPHPGNLFIEPLPAAESASRPFRIVFVDFGMVGRIDESVRTGLREAMIGIGTKDSARVMKAFQLLDVLLPSADVGRIEQAQTEAMRYAWGKTAPELARMSRKDQVDFAMKYRDLMYEMPFQIPQNFIYLGRALGMLSGMCTLLDPDFKVWEPASQYAQKLIEAETRDPRFWINEALSLGQAVLAFPRQAQAVMAQLQQGRMEFQAAPNPNLDADLRRLEWAVGGVAQALVFGSLLIAGTWLYTTGNTTPGLIGYGLAGVSWLLLMFRRRGRRPG